jgi:hypothetical protein
MKVSKQFLRDFAYVANLYGWNAADIEDAKAQTKANPGEMCVYWTRLAAAHRAGYAQNRGTNYMRRGAMLMTESEPHGYIQGWPQPNRNITARVKVGQ